MRIAHDSQNLFLEGPAGRLEAILWTPTRADSPPLAAVICHPHPLFGGTMHNKVVYNAAKTLDVLGIPVLRFNFRGAGLSDGEHDQGRGEQGDVQAALDFLAAQFPNVPLLLAGFSFGSFVGLRVGCRDARVSELIGMGIPEYEAKRYEGRVKDGGILISVHSDGSEWTKRAKEILEQTGAQDISSSSEASADFAKSDRPLPRTGTAG